MTCVSAEMLAPVAGEVIALVGRVLSTFTVIPAAGVSMLPALSVARERILYEPSAGRAQTKLQLPPASVAAVHVAPLSVETSTPATPEPASASLPKMVTLAPVRAW